VPESLTIPVSALLMPPASASAPVSDRHRPASRHTENSFARHSAPDRQIDYSSQPLLRMMFKQTLNNKNNDLKKHLKHNYKPISTCLFITN
jgi:hypothetical protein